MVRGWQWGGGGVRGEWTEELWGERERWYNNEQRKERKERVVKKIGKWKNWQNFVQEEQKFYGEHIATFSKHCHRVLFLSSLFLAIRLQSFSNNYSDILKTSLEDKKMMPKMYLWLFKKHCYYSGLQRCFLKNIAKGKLFSSASKKHRNIPFIAADLETSFKKNAT